MNRPFIQYRATDEFRRAQHSKASGLRVAGAKARQTFDIRMELVRKRAKLVEQMLAPLGRLLEEDASSQQALTGLKDLSSATKGQLRDQHKKLQRAPRRAILPAILYGSTSGTVWTGPPFDDTWTDIQGNNLATAEVNGDVNTSYSCSGDILLWAFVQILKYPSVCAVGPATVFTSHSYPRATFEIRKSTSPADSGTTHTSIPAAV